MINANYGALFPELFRTDASRATANAMRQAFQLVAMIISIALTPVVTGALGYSLTAILCGLLGGAVILYMSFSFEGERRPSMSRWQQKPATSSHRSRWIWAARPRRAPARAPLSPPGPGLTRSTPGAACRERQPLTQGYSAPSLRKIGQVAYSQRRGPMIQ